MPAASLAVGDIVLVRPGDRVSADGEVIEGESEVDESPVTGESVPVPKAEGAPVFAGSINAFRALQIRVTRPAADNTIARIIRLVEEAQEAKAPAARFIERFSALYTSGAVAAAALVVLLPPLLLEPIPLGVGLKASQILVHDEETCSDDDEAAPSR